MRNLDPIPKEPTSWAAKYTGVGKICDLLLKSLFISKTVRDRRMVVVER